jgi:hypothetical protein
LAGHETTPPVINPRSERSDQDRGARMTASADGVAARGEQARRNLVVALRDCCELADAVDSLEGQELLEVLVYLDSLRFVMAESGQLLQGVVRGFEDAEDA